MNNNLNLQEASMPGACEAWVQNQNQAPANAAAMNGNGTGAMNRNAAPTVMVTGASPVLPAAAAGNGAVSGSGLRHGLGSDVIGSPISAEEAYQGSLRAMLGRQIGSSIAATFLLGTGQLARWEGRLYEVGNNYIVIYQEPQGRYVAGDLNSLRFVEFSENGQSFGNTAVGGTMTETITW